MSLGAGTVDQTGAMANDAVPTVDPGLLDDLEARGLIHDTTDLDRLRSRLLEGPITVYVGFDPTAASLHVGNLIGLLTLRRFQDAGHKVISLAGGATGMVGDPSGRSSERNLLDDDGLAANLAGIVPQLRQFLRFEDDAAAAGVLPAKLLDNRAWTVGQPMLQFLRDIGKHVTVNQMLAKDSVKSRLDSTDGLTYTEFSYMLLQAMDFAWLYANEGCELQMGGSDQWGNIVTGCDLIRKIHGGSGFALTWPLLTKADGEKYGKTAGGETIWLSAEMMSPYRFYQAWIQVEDDELRKLLAQLTLLSITEIDEVMTEHDEAPHLRVGQRRLAHELTTIVHGPEATAAAVGASAAVFGAPVADLDAAALAVLADELPGGALDRDELMSTDGLITALVTVGAAKSRSEAGRLLDQNGISVNDEKAASDRVIGESDVLPGDFLILRRGRKQAFVLRTQGK